MAQEDKGGADSALALAADPSRFLSTAQIGITAVGLIAGAYSGANLAGDLTMHLVELGLAGASAEWAAYAVVFSAVTYLSLILGELVPKNLALRNPEAIACAVAPPMAALSRIAAPAVWVLDASIRALFRLVRYKPRQQSSVTEAEIKAFEDIVTPADVLEAIAGAFRSDTYGEEPPAVRREDGSWLLAGRMPAGEMADQLGIMLAVDRDYQTSPASCCHTCDTCLRSASTLTSRVGALKSSILTGVASTRSWRREFPYRGDKLQSPDQLAGAPERAFRPALES